MQKLKVGIPYLAGHFFIAWVFKKRKVGIPYLTHSQNTYFIVKIMHFSEWNNTVLEYIQRIKIEAAKRNFESCRKNINEVIFDVGYTDTKAFRTVFKKITGLTPIEYRNKYNKQSVMGLFSILNMLP